MLCIIGCYILYIMYYRVLRVQDAALHWEMKEEFEGTAGRQGSREEGRKGR